MAPAIQDHLVAVEQARGRLNQGERSSLRTAAGARTMSPAEAGHRGITPRNTTSPDEDYLQHQSIHERSDTSFALPLPEEIAAMHAAILFDAADRKGCNASARSFRQDNLAGGVAREGNQEQGSADVDENGEARREQLNATSACVDDEVFATELQARLFLADEYDASSQDEEPLSPPHAAFAADLRVASPCSRNRKALPTAFAISADS